MSRVEMLEHESIRVVYTMTRERKFLYRLGDGNFIWAAERAHKPLYNVRDNIFEIFMPLFGCMKPFLALRDGYVAPAWECKKHAQPLNYMYWLPEDYSFVYVPNNLYERPWYEENVHELVFNQQAIC